MWAYFCLSKRLDLSRVDQLLAHTDFAVPTGLLRIGASVLESPHLRALVKSVGAYASAEKRRDMSLTFFPDYDIFLRGGISSFVHPRHDRCGKTMPVGRRSMLCASPGDLSRRLHPAMGRRDMELSAIYSVSPCRFVRHPSECALSKVSQRSG